MIDYQNNHLLNWLQDFCVERKQESRTILPFDLHDKEILTSRYLEAYPISSDLCKISVLGNPGWVLKFGIVDSKFKTLQCHKLRVNTMKYEEDEWLIISKLEEYFDGAAGPQYLSVILECFRRFIEGNPLKIDTLDELKELRDKLRPENELIDWFEDYLVQESGRDMGGFGYSNLGLYIITTADGWLVRVDLEDLEVADKEFQDKIIEEDGGIVRVNRIEDHLIIRAHPKGLITGLLIFRNWVDS